MTPEAQIDRWFRDLLVALNPRKLTADSALLNTEISSGSDVGVPFPMPLSDYGRIVVVAIGKAAIAMATGAQERLGERFERGYVLTVDGPDADPLDARWTVFRAGHPIPDQRGIDATREILGAVETLKPSDTVIALISGGGSALFEAPRAPLTLEDFAEVTRLLLEAGAPIQHLNMVRIPLSQVKGGTFRRSSPAGRFATLVLSDVIGNDTRIIASGPTVEPATTGATALAILDLYGLQDRVSPAIRTVLNEVAEEEFAWEFTNDVVEIVGDVRLAIALAGDLSTGSGYATRVDWDLIEGEAAESARTWVARLMETPRERDVVWSGGETTVTVRGDGSGGRNTEFALAAALELDRLQSDEWVIASLATDGQDGNSGSAGAIASRDTIARAREMGISPEAALARNDSAGFFEQVGGLVMTGPSGTNVNDLQVAVRRRS